MGMGMRYSLMSMVKLGEGGYRGIREEIDKGMGREGEREREGERGKERLGMLLYETCQITS